MTSLPQAHRDLIDRVRAFSLAGRRGHPTVTREEVAAAICEGMTQREIARVVGLSRTRIGQLVGEARRRGELT